ncbi:MAG TPA: dihydroorotase [Kiritimatiellia bacterium]|nr:dihydroorotase [Kiritimatiellia bacterium]HMP35416.1 dihydroorotase [Kiritimatiellia bacterium]
MTKPWIIRQPLDMHLHLRQGDMLKTVTPVSAEPFVGAVIMPNLVPPVTTVEHVIAYRDAILATSAPHAFVPLMTLFFRDYRAEELAAAKPHILAIKLYPDGVTTNSDSDVRDLARFHHVFKAMEELHIPLLVHGETHGFVMDREREFLPSYEFLAENYPSLVIVMEHITTADAVALLDRYENLYATVTLHHLLLTLDDMAGRLLKPHLFCKPILKRPEDREALQQAALAGHPKLMFGSDSAPHPVSAKECPGCAAGVFTAPVCLPLLADFFRRNGADERLQGFISDHARQLHRLDLPEKNIRLEQIPWKVPERYGSVVPFMAGEEIGWRATVV